MSQPLQLTGLPAGLELKKIPVPDGEAVLAMIQAQNFVAVVQLDKAAVTEWARAFTEARDSMSGSRLAVATPGQAAMLGQAMNGQPPR